MMLTDIDTNNIDAKIIKEVLFSTPTYDYREADVLIVFGCHLKFALDERINYALSILNTKKINKIILTGGVGAKGDFNEAEYMLNVLLSNGISRDAIIVEDKSTTTEENVINTIEILKSHDLLTNKKIILLSNEPHLRRIRMEFNHLVKNCNIEYVCEYPKNSLVSYDKVMETEESQALAVNEIKKIIRFINEGIIENEEINTNSI